MSTRGATGFVSNGKWYVTYNHSSSYPEWLGMRVLEFCKTIVDWDNLKEKVAEIVLVDEDSKPTAEQIEQYRPYANLDVSSRSVDDWYCLLRNLQGEGILEAIAKGWVQHMIEYHMFLAESLFCEWAYVIDLDDMTLKVYKGFNTEYHPDTLLPPDIDLAKKDSDGYYPVRMLYAYDLLNLPEFILGVTNEFKNQYRLEHKPA